MSVGLEKRCLPFLLSFLGSSNHYHFCPYIVPFVFAHCYPGMLGVLFALLSVLSIGAASSSASVWPFRNPSVTKSREDLYKDFIPNPHPYAIYLSTWKGHSAVTPRDSGQGNEFVRFCCKHDIYGATSRVQTRPGGEFRSTNAPARYADASFQSSPGTFSVATQLDAGLCAADGYDCQIFEVDETTSVADPVPAAHSAGGLILQRKHQDYLTDYKYSNDPSNNDFYQYNNNPTYAQYIAPGGTKGGYWHDTERWYVKLVRNSTRPPDDECRRVSSFSNFLFSPFSFSLSRRLYCRYDGTETEDVCTGYHGTTVITDGITATNLYSRGTSTDAWALKTGQDDESTTVPFSGKTAYWAAGGTVGYYRTICAFTH